ncbi:MAG TPA: hypothetical protein DCG64_03595 [Alphaproteobacteria bacterium]|nr:hypothetical protein [Alphaproteobacteria bacterium]
MPNPGIISPGIISGVVADVILASRLDDAFIFISNEMIVKEIRRYPLARGMRGHAGRGGHLA